MVAERRGYLAAACGLLEVVDLAAAHRRMRELKGDAFPMPPGRKAPSLDDGDFVRHVGMCWIMVVV
jgi:hypothetical protein